MSRRTSGDSRLFAQAQMDYAGDVATNDGIPPIELGEEYTEYSKGRVAGPGGAGERHSLFVAALLYLPNRICDFLDIFKVDVGVGPSAGAVVRLSRFVQAGARAVPTSLRLGLRGRNVPLWVETSSEIGISPFFKQSSDRKVGDAEVGAGVDLIILGGYLGLDLGQAVDFFAGIAGIDTERDDF